MKNLMIVESPTKVKSIEKFLGPDFKVIASVGHVRDLVSSARKGRKAFALQDKLVEQSIEATNREIESLRLG